MDQLLALRVFVRIAESGAFSKAADAMNIPRPTVTKLVQDLERHLGTRLLQRTTRRVSVTPEGAAYYERATRLIADLQEMDEQAAQSRAQARGRLRVDIGSVLANMILIPALPAFRARHPELHIDLGVSDRPVDLIGEGVDCVIRGGELADTSLVARRIADLDWVTCASPLYLKARGVPKHPSELAARTPQDGDRVPGHAIVGYFSSLTGKAFPLEFHRGDEHLQVAGQAVVAVNESTAHLSALLSGAGLGQAFKFMVHPHANEGRLRTVLDDWTRPRHPLHVVYPASRHLSAKLRLFVDWIAEVFAPFDDRP
ncbi:LysR substrate-binding domain-containing protein [Piscinibacter gummiphilus]|uniref:LysR family transcriptional regulator n=1 Tax=Piscinibacter gummiphilus TaxID=946333 RepID=A0A1W6L6Q8_9BURK|nr:LysR substrate-binding domain-containing protein [Piscinibacter gummiphilus]ARN19943.1 LysR family transcriptional regulator [Piscinibacter gummiphilus]ATU64617.1 LysR family transcriptional regulator [Piscinibacter gummiphilus]GLS94964.1 LysR family transcriptional regulator [Piscinibacter gummiphilus]